MTMASPDRVQAAQAPASISAVSPKSVLQRACACGRHSGNGGECAECRKKRLGLQRRAVGQGPDVAPPIVHDVLRSPGRPLDNTTRGFMESRFNHDFSGVRIHTDGRAAESARAVNALAYTVGNHIAFDTEEYAPTTRAGRGLLAHELIHTAQQNTGEQTSSVIVIGAADNPMEHQAQTLARQVNNSQPGTQISDSRPTDGPVLQRVPVGPIVGGAAAGLVLGAVTFAAAYAYGRSLATRYPGWLSALPNCPCTEAAARANPPMWTPDANPILGYFHPGATASYRSVGTYSSAPGTAHGQQCTYDSGGDLITSGPGAGTPDVWSPNASTTNHFLHDVTTWQVLGWRIYNQFWQPNTGGGACAANSGDR